ncbi:MAG TPA: family 10 glycosylhydrolase, partial [Sandaracinaceae bacterium]
MSFRAPLLLALLAACGGDPAPRDAGTSDARAPLPDAGAVDARAPLSDGAPREDAGPGDAGPPLVPVGHERELRAAWVASVFNLTWPSRTGLGESEARAEITHILDVLAELRMNAAVVQVRPESDALYRSELEPWSRFLTGTQGVDPGWDPLAVWIEEAHARGIELHAWINPYRGLTSTSVSAAPNHVTRTLSEHTVPWRSSATNTMVWMDPGASEVRAHVVAVVRDIVERYDVDGIHFDDYFYPYPVQDISQSFADDDSYAAYVASGGMLARDDWRRENVNTLVREVSEAIAEVRDDVRFSISPFGIHRPGMPPGIVGLDAYATIYCDAPRWIEEGWVDDLAPQLYWPSTQTAQAFGALIEWWAQRPRDPARSIVAGMNLTRIGSAGWPLEEYRTQVELTRAQRALGARGVMLYTAEPLVDDLMGLRALFRDELFTSPAASPLLASASGAALPPPAVALDGNMVTPSGPSGARVRTYAVYAQEPGGWTLVRLTRGAVELAPGTYAISAIDRRGVESGGVEVHVP